MTNSLFFDSDCISAFLWVDKQCLLSILYPGRIVIPKPVYDEISNPAVPHLKQRIDYLIKNNLATLDAIDVGSETYILYQKLTINPDSGHKVIGSGEAASIAMAKTSGGVVASNNLKDIKSYLSEFNLQYITSSDILVEAMEKGLITEDQGNNIWASMIARKRKLGAITFSEYLKIKTQRVM